MREKEKKRGLTRLCHPKKKGKEGVLTVHEIPGSFREMVSSFKGGKKKRGGRGPPAVSVIL